MQETETTVPSKRLQRVVYASAYVVFEALARPSLLLMTGRIIARLPLLCLLLTSLVYADTDVLPPSPGKTFSDVPSSHPYAGAIGGLSAKKILKGYSDGTFHPNTPVNRAELLALAYRAKSDIVPYKPAVRCFLDVLPVAWYAPYVCAARDARIIEGYADRRFHAERQVNVAEAAKILVGLSNMNVQPPVAGEIWHKPYMDALAGNNYLPPTLTSMSQEVTRGEAVEMLYRIREQKKDLPSVKAATLMTAVCQPLGEEVDARFDMERVREAWFGWIADARKQAGLPAYEHNRQLDRTALAWAKNMRDTGTINHKRNPGDPYYDYWKINQWFAGLGIEAKNINRVTHTENIGGGFFSCQKTECTDDLIAAVRPTFDFYMAEKGKASHAHYDSIMNKTFTQVGFGAIVAGTQVYSTTHYSTEIVSEPVPVCQ